MKKRRRRIYTYVLLAAGTDRVKIGRTTNFRNRLADLQCACPVELIVLGVFPGDHEQGIHLAFRDERLHGEWFRLSYDLRDWIEDFPPRRYGCSRRRVDPVSLLPPVVVTPRQYDPSKYTGGRHRKVAPAGQSGVRLVDWLVSAPFSPAPAEGGGA